MARNKNQHFVPKVYLRGFSPDGGSAINLYNISANRGVENAPTKGQCAKHYFYGKDLALETAFQSIEGRYARVLATLQVRGVLSSDDLQFLRDFAYLQYLRTEAAFDFRRRTMIEMQEVTHRGFDRDPPPLDLSDPAIAREMIGTFANTKGEIEDLEICILLNATTQPLVTSDDPSVLTNRVHLQRLKEDNFGLISSGAMLYLPLTPRFALLCYDGDAYSLPNRKNGVVSFRKEEDAIAVNALQYLNARENIYFSAWASLAEVRSAFKAVEPRRLVSRSRFWIGVPTGETAGAEFYRRATPEEVESPIPKIVSFSPMFPSPPRWPSEIRFKNKITAMNNGSGPGYVRIAAGRRQGLADRWLTTVPAVPEKGRSRSNPATAMIVKQ